MKLHLDYLQNFPTISFRLFFLRLGRIYSLSDYDCLSMPMLMPCYGKKLICNNSIPRSTFDLNHKKVDLDIFPIIELLQLNKD